jgi:xanthine/CO dehydrogenase XdhC/CoxF family maturation factor
LVTYDTRAEDDLVWGLGLGCNGRVDVLLEPLTGRAIARARALYTRCRDLSAPAVLATVIAAPVGGEGEAPLGVGDRVLLTASGETMWSSFTPDSVSPRLVAHAREALATRRSAVHVYGPVRDDMPGLEVLHEVMAPPLALIVCGAGADAVPLVRLAVGLGWRVTVSDHRPAYARPDHFPGATVVLIDRDAPAIEHLTGSGCDAAIVMSHNYERDRLQLRALVAAGVPYVGVLGPRRRTERMLADLGVSDAEAARVYAPIGLDIGAETPDEIALAIVAEVQSAQAGRRGGPLRERTGGIHALPAPP